MKCRFCGDIVHSINQKLFSSIGERCLGNPEGKHIGVTDGQTCVFCGDSAHFQSGKLFTKLGTSCRNSSTGMHRLQ